MGHGAQERRSQAAAALCRRAQVRRGGIPRQDGGALGRAVVPARDPAEVRRPVRQRPYHQSAAAEGAGRAHRKRRGHHLRLHRERPVCGKRHVFHRQRSGPHRRDALRAAQGEWLPQPGDLPSEPRPSYFPCGRVRRAGQIQLSQRCALRHGRQARPARFPVGRICRAAAHGAGIL